MVPARELIRFLLRQGYHRARQAGSHVILEHPSRKPLVIPVHAGDLPKGLFGSNLALCYSVEEVLAQSRRQIRPLNLRHHSPKVIRASSLFKRSRSAGSVDSVSWVVNEKNRSFSASLDARPVSIKSTSTRLALVFLVFATNAAAFGSTSAGFDFFPPPSPPRPAFVLFLRRVCLHLILAKPVPLV